MNRLETLKVTCCEPVLTDDGRQLQTILASLNQKPVARVRFWCQICDACPMLADGRTALLTFLPLAMRLQIDIEVMDSVDAMTVANLDEWQHAMVKWMPGTLHTVRMLTPNLTLSESKPRAGNTAGSMMAFSGGVDSCHTLWRHSSQRKQSCVLVKTGLMVHGMDIPMSDTKGFQGASERARKMLQAHGANLRTVATDIRDLEQLFGLDWERHTHGIVLAACLSLFDRQYDAVLVASTYPVNDLQLPWGSNPVTDPLLAGPTPYLHDGSSFNKLDKVQGFAEDAVLAEHVRVCWQGDRRDANCGKCFKCLATQAAFWIAGVARPAAFDRPAQVQDLTRLRIKNAVNYRLVAGMCDAAARAGRTDIATALHKAMRKSKWHIRLKVARWLARVGINERTK